MVEPVELGEIGLRMTSLFLQHRPRFVADRLLVFVSEKSKVSQGNRNDLRHVVTRVLLVSHVRGILQNTAA